MYIDLSLEVMSRTHNIVNKVLEASRLHLLDKRKTIDQVISLWYTNSEEIAER